jgi:hypothetical protein
MNEKRCILTNVVLTQENDSKAHVIPSALGSRLKPLGILSKEANKLLCDKFDFPLIEAFQSLMNLLNASRDRGKNQPTPMTDQSGKTYLFQFGEHLAIPSPEYEETPAGDKIIITIKARTLKEARTLLGRTKAKHPEFDIDEAMEHAVNEHQWPDGMLNHQLQIGPRVVFPAAFVAASIFAAYYGQRPHPRFRTYVGDFDPSNPIMPPDTFYFMPKKNWVTTPSEVTHILALAGDTASGQLLAYIELFNLTRVAVLLPFEGPDEIRSTYAIDVLTGKQVSTHIDEAALISVPWTATHQLGDTSLFEFTKTRFDELVQLALKRDRDDTVHQMLDRAWGPPNGRPLMPRDYANLVGEIAAFTERLWKHPAVTPEIRQQDLLLFDGFCLQLANRIPANLRSEFHRLANQRRQALTEAANTA